MTPQVKDVTVNQLTDDLKEIETRIMELSLQMKVAEAALSEAKKHKSTIEFVLEQMED